MNKMLLKGLSMFLKSLFGYEYELLFVNDVSKDDSVKSLIEISKKDSNVRIVSFSRICSYIVL